jgi:hypothetical protein
MSKAPLFHAARRTFHGDLKTTGVLCLTSRGKHPGGVPSNADSSSQTSISIARAIFDQIQTKAKPSGRLAGQVSGSRFELVTRDFIEATFLALGDLRPGKWSVNSAGRNLFQFEQYHHLAELIQLGAKNPEIEIVLGNDYVIAPDILLVRQPEPDAVINAKEPLVDEGVALRTALRLTNNKLPILHASISCKWTLRSDRAQNARSEALNLIRNRKGRLPHIVVVTGEPLPSRLASLALGTGDIDCVYHFALPELINAVEKLENEDSTRLVRIMVEGKRLKDISDLPLDLAV